MTSNRLPILILLILAVASCKDEREWGVDTFVDNAELTAWCKSGDNGRSACYAYILGVVDSRNVSFAQEHKADWLCGEPTRQDVLNAVGGYLQAHPEHAALAAASLVEVAVDKSFGCKKH